MAKMELTPMGVVKIGGERWLMSKEKTGRRYRFAPSRRVAHERHSFPEPGSIVDADDRRFAATEVVYDYGRGASYFWALEYFPVTNTERNKSDG